jgi:hypothetical protein
MFNDRPNVNSSGRIDKIRTGYREAIASVASVDPESTRMISTADIVCSRIPLSNRPICFSSLNARRTIEHTGLGEVTFSEVDITKFSYVREIESYCNP